MADSAEFLRRTHDEEEHLAEVLNYFQTAQMVYQLPNPRLDTEEAKFIEQLDWKDTDEYLEERAKHTKVCRICNEPGHYASQCPNCHNCGSEDHTQENCPAAEKFKGFCKSCNAKVGHRTQNCPNVVCRICYRKGHTQAACDWKDACHNCGASNHKRIRCPKDLRPEFKAQQATRKQKFLPALTYYGNKESKSAHERATEETNSANLPTGWMGYQPAENIIDPDDVKAEFEQIDAEDTTLGEGGDDELTTKESDSKAEDTSKLQKSESPHPVEKPKSPQPVAEEESHVPASTKSQKPKISKHVKIKGLFQSSVDGKSKKSKDSKPAESEWSFQPSLDGGSNAKAKNAEDAEAEAKVKEVAAAQASEYAKAKAAEAAKAQKALDELNLQIAEAKAQVDATVQASEHAQAELQKAAKAKDEAAKDAQAKAAKNPGVKTNAAKDAKGFREGQAKVINDAMKFQASFPNGYELKNNVASNLECGYHAIRDAFIAQYPFHRAPTLDELRSICAEHMPEWTSMNEAFEDDPGAILGLNDLTLDQMAVIFHQWAMRNILLIQLGCIVKGVPQTYFHAYQHKVDEYLGVHLHEGHYQACVPKTLFDKYETKDTATELTPQEAEEEFAGEEDNAEPEASSPIVHQQTTAEDLEDDDNSAGDAGSKHSNSNVSKKSTGDAKSDAGEPPSDTESDSTVLSSHTPPWKKGSGMPMWMSDNALAEKESIVWPIATAPPTLGAMKNQEDDKTPEPKGITDAELYAMDWGH